MTSSDRHLVLSHCFDSAVILFIWICSYHCMLHNLDYKSCKLSVFHINQGVGYHACNGLLNADVLKLPHPLVIVVSYHVATKVNGLGYLVDDAIVASEHRPLIVHVYIHWKGNLHKVTTKKLNKSQPTIAGVRHDTTLSLGGWWDRYQLFVSKPSDKIVFQVGRVIRVGLALSIQPIAHSESEHIERRAWSWEMASASQRPQSWCQAI